MRALTAIGVFEETGPQTYVATPVSLLMVGDEVRDQLKFMFVADSPIPG